MAELKDTTGREGRKDPPPNTPPAITIMADRTLDLIPDSTIYTGTVIQSKLKQAEYGDLAGQLVMFNRMIENDAHLWSIVQTRRLTVKKAERTLVPPEGFEDDQDALAAVVYTKEVLSRMHGFKDLVPTMIDGPVRGFAANEVIWDGPVPIAVVDVPDEVWRYKSGTGLQYRGKDGVWREVPADKFVIHSPRNNSSVMMRRGAMRPVIKWWLIKNISTRDWAAFVELFGIPHRKVVYPSNYSGSDPVVQEVIMALRSMGASGITAVRKDFEVELITAAATGSKGDTPHEALVRWCDAQMSKAILGQTLTVDTAQATGTYAAATVHNEVRLDIAQADGEGIGERIREDLITPLVGYGLGWEYPVPEYVIKIEDPVDEKTRADVLKIAIKDLGLPVAMATVYEELRIREPEEGEELLDVPQTSSNLFGGGSQGDDDQDEGDEDDGDEAGRFRRDPRLAALMARDDALGEVPIALEALALLSDREWREAESATIPEAILRMIEANPELGSDPEELLRRLGTFYIGHDSDELAEHLERTMNSSIVNAGFETELEDESESENVEDEEELLRRLGTFYIGGEEDGGDNA